MTIDQYVRASERAGKKAGEAVIEIAVDPRIDPAALSNYISAQNLPDEQRRQLASVLLIGLTSLVHYTGTNVNDSVVMDMLGPYYRKVFE
jgi:hypothetical protein